MTDLVKKLQVVKAFNRSESSFHSITETKKDDSYETVYFHGKPILCTKRSLYLIPVRNKFRMTMLWIQEWKWFDRFILFLIALNSLFLALQDFSFRLDESNKNWRNTIVEESEIYFLGFFTLEASIKILGKGFIIGTGTYLKDAWNILDFLVVVIGWLGFIPGMANVSALRTIRVLRPLKSVKQIRSLRKMVMSLFRSLPDLANVAIFLLFIFIVFGIIGVALLQGNLYQRCRYTDEPDGDSWEADPDITQLCALDQTGLYSCPDDRYCGLPGSEGLFEYDFYREAQIPELDFGIPNFDNLASACLTIFQISTLEGWNNMMYAYYDSYSPTLLSIYFSIMVLCISFFILNLMLAVSWSSFKVIKDEDNVAYPRFANTDESLQNEDLDSVRLREEIKKVEEFRRLDSIGDRATGVRPKETEHSVGFIASEQHDALKETEKEKKKITFAISDKGNTEQTTGDPFQTYKTICTDANTPKRIVGFRETQGQEELSPECWPDDNSPNKTAQESTKIAPSNAVTGLMRKETLKRRVTRKLATIDNDSLRWKLIGIVNSQNWGYAINICIIINTIFLALDRYPMPEEEQRVYEIANIIFFSIFLIEMILKLLALHPQAYCLDSFNVFDGFIVILSCIEVVLFYSGIVGDGGSAISAFRAFRLLRIFKLAKKWPEVRKLMNTIFLCLKDVSYFSVLLLLFMFIYTLIGMEIYAYKLRFSGDDVDLQDGTSPRNNFDNFLHAFVSVYAALVGDDWQYMMYDAIR